MASPVIAFKLIAALSHCDSVGLIKADRIMLLLSRIGRRLCFQSDESLNFALLDHCLRRYRYKHLAAGVACLWPHPVTDGWISRWVYYQANEPSSSWPWDLLTVIAWILVETLLRWRTMTTVMQLLPSSQFCRVGSGIMAASTGTILILPVFQTEPKN